MKTTSRFCWLCQTNFALTVPVESHYLDEDGNKPCFDCMQEMEQPEEGADS